MPEVDPELDRLARKIVELYGNTPPDKRLLVAIAGPPGSGKSTLAYPLTAHLNALLTGQPEAHATTDDATGLTHVDAGTEPIDEDGGSGRQVAICVGLDGWHYSRAELDAFPDPKEAHWRRGAAFTFNLASYTSFLESLTSPSRPIPFPTFSHALKDPLPSPHPIRPSHRIVIVEGLYTLLDRPGWRECAARFDVRVWVECAREVCRERVIERNWAAGVVRDREACEERVDASDMVNGDEVRDNIHSPTYIIRPADEPDKHKDEHAG